MRRWTAPALMLLAGLLLAGPAWAQQTAPESAASAEQTAQAAGPRDPFGRDTPAGAMEGYLEATQANDWETAAHYLDLRNLSEPAAGMSGAALAEQLSFVLSRAFWEEAEWSHDPLGDLADRLPEYRDPIGHIEVHGRRVLLMLQRVPGPGQTMVWKVSNATVEQIPEYHAQLQYPPLIERLKSALPDDVAPLGLELFKWITALIVGLLCVPLFLLLAWVGTRLATSPGTRMRKLVWRLLSRPVLLLGVLLVMRWTVLYLGVSAEGRQTLRVGTTMTIVIVWLAFSLLNLFRDHRAARLRDQGREGAARLLWPATNAAKLVIVLLALLTWLHNLGVNVTTLLAGLGVGGIAVALALQKPLEDLMGAITIYAQQPFRLGDLCQYGQFLGTVEEIGLRNTRIRTLGNTLVTIPNSKIANTEVDNISARQSIRYNAILRLKYDTTRDQLNQVLNGVRELLVADERVLEDRLRVRLREFGEFALNVEVNAYVDTMDFDEYLAAIEELNLEIFRIVEDAGASFAVRDPRLGGLPSSSPTSL
ncbi:MAG: mechanosensitive ion channel family protein [Xanthomonadales bacterium]|nr:mechanosensitive ion channel family protein [Xanthomonadales bacterium]